MRLVPLLILGTLATACAKEAPPADTTAAPQQVTITATDFAFTLPPATIHAGLTTVTLVNQGAELHHVTLVQLTDGKSVDDLMTAVQSEGPPPPWAIAMGGPNAAPPGGEANATLILDPGTYALLCFIPSPDGVPHMAKGMIIGLEVQPATGAVAALPPGDIDLTLADYSFALSQTPSAGTQTVRVVNQGVEIHEVALVRLAPGATIEQFMDWMAAGEQGPPPGEAVGGVSGLSPGQVQNFTADFPAGTYGMLCFVRAPDGAPHFAHGMIATFTVS